MGKNDIIDIQGIMERIPHRIPFIMVDRVEEIGDKKIKAYKNVTINEWFFQGHFPTHPVMPGVLVVEGMAQAGAILMVEEYDLPHEMLLFFMTIDKVKFRKQVVPGDKLVYEIEVRHFSSDPNMARGKLIGKALVDGKVVAQAEMAALGQKSKSK